MGKEAGVPAPVGEDETRATSGSVEGSIAGRRARLQATLKILTGLEAGRTHMLVEHQTVIGRSAHCDLSIDNEELSRRHCRVFRSGDTFVIEDLGSRNGTRIDDDVISFGVPLREGAIIHLAAGVAIKFSSQDELEVKAEQRLYESAVLDALTGEMFGMARLCRAFEAAADRSVEAIRDSIMGEVRGFMSEQVDDLTLVVLRYR